MEKYFVQTLEQGIDKAKKILYEKVDRRTVFFLSGGTSPKPLYQDLAQEKKLHPAAVAFIDERYGKPMHENSNEKMIRRTGLLNYFIAEHIPVHGILQNDLSREDTALRYDQAVRKLFFNIPKSFSIIGLGKDGHIAGLAPIVASSDERLASSLKKLTTTYNFVGSYNDEAGSFGERITLTFQALAMIDYFILWVFGDEKHHALGKVFTQGSLEEIPGRFFNQDEIAKKTMLITDQRV